MIKIFTSNGLELPYEKETLSIKEENNAFKDSFSLQYSEFPFIVKDTPEVIRELGSSEENSTNYVKDVDVTLEIGPSVYFGKLKILEYLKGRRKCVLRFSKKFVEILDRRIADFMPTYYFGDQVPYSETTSVEFDQQAIMQNIKPHLEQQYPEVDFAMPQIRVGNYYKGDDNWKNFLKEINYRNAETLVLNTKEKQNELSYLAKNFNSYTPMPYLMAMLRNPVVNSGYNLAGSFVDNTFNQKIIVIPNKNNNTSIDVNTPIIFTKDDFVFSADFSLKNALVPLQFSDLGEGTFTLDINLFKIPGYTTNGYSGIKVNRYKNGSIIETLLDEQSFEYGSLAADYTNSLTFEIDGTQLDESLLITYAHSNRTLPNSIDIQVKGSEDENILYLMHPTVELSRYVPDWTLGKLINELKNFQNLKVDFDDISKTLLINYNQEFLANKEFVDLSNDVVYVKRRSNRFENKHELSFSNEIGTVSVEKGLIKTETISLDSDVTQIKNAFKILSSNDYAIETTKEEMEQSGITLALYNGGLYTAKDIGGYTLDLDGERGLTATYWLSWLNFRQKSKHIEAVAHLQDFTVEKIKQLQKVYFNNRMYAVVSSTVTPKKFLNEVVLELENIIEGLSVENVEVLNPSVNISATALEPNFPFTPWLSWFISVTYNYVDFLNFNGTIYARQLEGAEGSAYTGLEFSKPANQINGGVSITFPILLTTEAGVYEVVLETPSGVNSEKVYVEVAPSIDEAAEKIILTEVAQPDVFFYYKGIFTIAFENYDVDPNYVEIWLEKIVNQVPNGLPTKTTVTPVGGQNYVVDFPSSGMWRVHVREGLIRSNYLSWLSLQI